MWSKSSIVPPPLQNQLKLYERLVNICIQFYNYPKLVFWRILTNLSYLQSKLLPRRLPTRGLPFLLWSQVRERPLDFQGGVLGFSVWPEYFFSNYHEPEYFFLKPYWARIFFSIQYKFGSNFSVEPQIGYKTIILRLSAVCLCVCPTATT